MPPLAVQLPAPPLIEYPESDGAPIAENTLQYEWISLIKGGLDLLYARESNVFVAGDLFWYPVEGDPSTSLAPDAMVVFGRPKGHRRSYKQWEEGGLAPQVVFEVMSPSNRQLEMAQKLVAYDRFGVEEYYVFDPEPGRFRVEGYVRGAKSLQDVPRMNGHVSPRLGVRFDVDTNSETLTLIGPDGRPFSSIIQVDAERQKALEIARAATDELNRLRALLREQGLTRP